MQTLRQALDNIAECAAAKKSAPPVLRIRCDAMGHCMIHVYNGTLAASVVFEEDTFPKDDISVDAATIMRVWQDGATAKVDDKQLVVKSRRTTYRIPILGSELFDCPQIVPGGVKLSSEARDAILLAAKFASQNASHPWATGVTLYKGRAIATNNVAFVAVKCDTTLEGLVPPWAIAALRADGEPPEIRIDEHGVSFTYEDSTVIQSAPMASSAPERLFTLLDTVKEGKVDLDPIIDLQKDMFRVKGKHVTLDPNAGVVIVSTEDGINSETEIDFGVMGEAVRLQQPIFKLIIDHATHIGFQSAPDKLVFSSDKLPEFIGVAACLAQ